MRSPRVLTDSDNVIPRNLTPEVLQAFRAVRFIAQHIKDADKDNEVGRRAGAQSTLTYSSMARPNFALPTFIGQHQGPPQIEAECWIRLRIWIRIRIAIRIRIIMAVIVVVIV